MFGIQGRDEVGGGFVPGFVLPAAPVREEAVAEPTCPSDAPAIPRSDYQSTGDSWETRRTLKRASPGITFRLPGAPPTSAGPRHIIRAYGQPEAGSGLEWANSGRPTSNSERKSLRIACNRPPFAAFIKLARVLHGAIRCRSHVETAKCAYSGGNQRLSHSGPL